MNVVILIGRLVREPEMRTTQSGAKVARYTLAVDRRFNRDGGQTADFISCTAFGKGADFTEKFLHKGMKIAITGKIQTGSYTGKDGNKVFTVDVVVDTQEFCESKAAAQEAQQKVEMGQFLDVPEGINLDFSGARPAAKDNDITGFLQIPDGISEELPFT